MFWGPLFLQYLGPLVNSDFGSYSLIRLAGVGFLLAGALLLAIRTLQDSDIQRRVSFALAATHLLGGLVIWAQQTAIWESPLGTALNGWLWLAAISFSVVLIQSRRASAAAQA